MRALSRRGPRPPADVVARAHLARGERVLSQAVATDGTWLLGTRDALVLVGEARVTRVPWQQVEAADWDRDADRLRVAEIGDFGRPRPEHAFAIEQPGTLLQLVRERVTASVVLQRRVLVSQTLGLTVVARRPPRGSGDIEGQITWAYELDPGVEPGDPGVPEAAARGLREAREELGLGPGPI